MRDYAYSGPPQLAVVAGDTTPDPGLVGARAWSTIEQRVLTWDGLTWALSRVMSEPHFEEVVRSAGRVVAIINWADATRTRKLSDVSVERSSGWAVSVVERQYNQAQVVVQTLTTTIARDEQGRASSASAVLT